MPTLRYPVPTHITALSSRRDETFDMDPWQKGAFFVHVESGWFIQWSYIPTQTMPYYRGIVENCGTFESPQKKGNYTTVKWLIIAAKPVSAWCATFQGVSAGEFHHISITWRVEPFWGGDSPAWISFENQETNVPYSIHRTRIQVNE